MSGRPLRSSVAMDPTSSTPGGTYPTLETAPPLLESAA